MKSIYLFTMDCLIRNGRPKKGATELLDILYRQQIPFVVTTQQSGKSREKLIVELRNAGFATIRHANIYTSSMAAVDFLSSRYKEKNKAAIVGGEGVKEAVNKAGYQIDRLHPDFIFIGMDRSLTYEDYCEVNAMIEDGGILVSVDDRKNQIVDSTKMVGNGAVVTMLEYSSGTDAIHFGAGSPLYLDMVIRYLNADPSTIVSVGTSFQRDIIPSLKKGMTTVYVTQGRSIVNEGMNEKIHPDYIVEDLSGLTR